MPSQMSKVSAVLSCALSSTKYGQAARGTSSSSAEHLGSAVPLPLLTPTLTPPHVVSVFRCVFVWCCFDRQCLCVWAVLAGRRACLVQS